MKHFKNPLTYVWLTLLLVMGAIAYAVLVSPLRPHPVEVPINLKKESTPSPKKMVPKRVTPPLSLNQSYLKKNL